MNPLEVYLKELRDNRSTGAAVAETSYYPALSNLFNAIGKTLKPKVRCVMTLADQGAGMPDGGFFTRDQFQRASDGEPKQGQLPARGAIEAKGPADDVRDIARKDQVRRYCARYERVLVTNYRQFLLLGLDAQGRPAPLEGYSLADSEAALWQAANHPQKTAAEHGERLAEYLTRVMLSNAPLSAPQDLANLLGCYAREARARVEDHKDLSALAAIRQALEEALGMKFTGEEGDHFFRSTLVQTLFYGVFSAWVFWHRQDPARTDEFNWRQAEWTLHVPFIRALYEQIATPRKLGRLDLVPVLEWTADALTRVKRESFFKQFQDAHAVQYFYEPFLEAFDPQLRKKYGVWYTPPEIVRYQVARVDAALRDPDGLNLPDGLADRNVVVLDPCCGTGAYLVEVLRRIGKTLREKGGDALVASDLKTAAMTRVFGFEIMPAPFVVSHLQLGLMLQTLGAPLNPNRDERAGVYLTNALTGWETKREDKPLPWSELEQERASSGRVKREERVLVILGNPPYNAFAGVSPQEEHGLVEPYKGAYEAPKPRKGSKTPKKILYDKDGHPIPDRSTITRYRLNDPVSMGGWGIKKFNLDDLYVRFFRLAERRIAEMTGKGVVSFISNFSYLGDPSFVVMRERFLSEFDALWFDCMNGDSRETGKLTPEGNPDPSVFSTRYNRAGIRVGTAVCVIVRKDQRDKTPTVRFRHFWGASKREDLVASLDAEDFDAAYTRAHPAPENRYSFRPENVSTQYNAWAKLPDLCDEGPFNGPVERRGNSLVVFEESQLSILGDYLDARKTDAQVTAIAPAFMKTSGEFNAEAARAKLKGRVSFDQTKIARYPFKPLDVRLAYLDPAIQPLFSRPSPELLTHAGVAGNAFFITRDSADKAPEGPPFYFSSLVCDYDSISGHARHFPFLLAPTGKGKAKEFRGQITYLSAPPKANLSPPARAYLGDLAIADPDTDVEAAGLIWMHALAIGYSPAYLSENADGIRRDWPRVPLPAGRAALEASAALGREVAALLDTEAEVPGVTAGAIEPVFRAVGVLARVGGGSLDPDAGDLAVTGGWGHAGKGGATMPGKGRVVKRPYTQAERDAVADAAKARGLPARRALALLGPDTRDVYLSEHACWRNVPSAVWDFYIGGYQVIKKWLSYREQAVLGRALRGEEAREATNIARRLAGLVLLQPALDDNYRRVKADAYPWPQTSA